MAQPVTERIINKLEDEIQPLNDGMKLEAARDIKRARELSDLHQNA